MGDKGSTRMRKAKKKRKEEIILDPKYSRRKPQPASS
jgi:hypothetical protein